MFVARTARDARPDQLEEVKKMVPNRRLILSAALVPAVVVAAAAGYAASTKMSPRMGPVTRISRKAFEGYYDGHKDQYLSTDVSTKAEATSMHVNYAPGLKAVPLGSAPEMYLVEGRAAAGQLAVFGSQPGESDYSPIWEGDDPDLEGERDAGADQERHAGRPARAQREAHRAEDVDQAQLPDRQGWCARLGGFLPRVRGPIGLSGLQDVDPVVQEEPNRAQRLVVDP